MDVLKTTSPTASPSKPCPLPRKTRPSSSSNVACLFFISVSGPPAGRSWYTALLAAAPCRACAARGGSHELAMAGPPTSIQATHLIYWPVSENGFAVDVLLRHEAPHAAVVRLVSMVAQNIVMTGLDIHGRI